MYSILCRRQYKRGIHDPIESNMTPIDNYLLRLPNEILLTILKKMNTMDVLYSLIGVGIERLDLLAQDKIFTNILNFVSTDIDNIF